MADQTTGADQIKQFKDFILNYNKLSEICFTDCVHDMTLRTVTTKEEQCANNCFDKFLKMNQRISQRFQEIQLQQTDRQQLQPQQQ
ncbi:mitochondrial import inner membrane translocase subunit Tim9-like [Oppia nitens]|uniref:mitochondrial import inner membrane translocase subunit Tim9-like n=1 Tax=Oppia nitens TaxID=1686743 RepID=UPI0023DAFBFF|nr:mitochondrial import inner membrane translocase subunit Tim9-like [Oppia nitens]